MSLQTWRLATRLSLEKRSGQVGPPDRLPAPLRGAGFPGRMPLKDKPQRMCSERQSIIYPGTSPHASWFAQQAVVILPHNVPR
jgi:hypothetical protein